MAESDRAWIRVRSVHQEVHAPLALCLQPFAQAMRTWASNSSDIVTFWEWVLEQAENGYTYEELMSRMETYIETWIENN